MALRYRILISDSDNPKPYDLNQHYKEKIKLTSINTTDLIEEDEPVINKKNYLTESLIKPLLFGSEKFIIKTEKNYSIIAGYPWFTDWGRDTMISLPGIVLVTGRYELGRSILKEFAQNMKNGLIPNLFPEEGIEPLYNTVDASLWFFEAAYKYYQYTNDKEFITTTLLKKMREIFINYRDGTDFNIFMDTDDYLINCGNENLNLTWMDACVDGKVITPRYGKPVEIQALWYNTVCIMEHFTGSEEYKILAKKIKNSFEKFILPDGYLADLLYNKEYEGDKDRSFRPNQLFALSLSHPVIRANEMYDNVQFNSNSPVIKEKISIAESIINLCTEYLLTPFGLRSLAPYEKKYRGSYGGTQRIRDEAYHQGTVWGWLIGPYITALVRIKGDNGRKRGIEIIDQFKSHLTDGGIFGISEIFDGDKPFKSRGCISQAWSVAELLRTAFEDLKMI